jgi:nucleoside-diphosphate-sugar epimerase
MKILVTGGAGYVGTSLVPILLDQGHEVLVLDNLMFGGDQLLPFFRRPNFSFVRGDIRNREDLAPAVRDRDVIVHLAAIVGYPACRKDPRLAEDVNVGGTRLLASLLSRDQLVLYGSTGSNYGKVEVVCTEETPLHPLSLYGQTKTLGEQHLLDNCTTVAYRFATAFGVSPRLRLDLLVNDFTYKSVTQGYLVVYEKHFKRTFIHVHDMGRAFALAIDKAETMKGEVYNAGSNAMNFSKEDICELIKAKVDCYIHYADIGEDADKRDYVVSYEKINRLGYDTTIGIEDGISELVRAFGAVSFKTPYTNI